MEVRDLPLQEVGLRISRPLDRGLESPLERMECLADQIGVLVLKDGVQDNRPSVSVLESYTFFDKTPIEPFTAQEASDEIYTYIRSIRKPMTIELSGEVNFYHRKSSSNTSIGLDFTEKSKQKILEERSAIEELMYGEDFIPPGVFTPHISIGRIPLDTTKSLRFHVHKVIEDSLQDEDKIKLKRADIIIPGTKPKIKPLV